MSVNINNPANSLYNTVNVLPDWNSTVIQVATPGPQGPPGPAADPSLFTSSFVSTSSFNTFTSSYNTGSFLGTFIGTFTGDGSGLTGLPNSQWTSSFDGSISRESDVFIIGSFSVTNQAGTSLFLIDAQGATTIQSTAANIFLVQNQNSVNILTINQSGVIVVATQSVELNNPAPNGAIYFTSNSFFVGLD
jgi:hypothetical protein